MLPDLRRGLSEESAKKVMPHLRTLTQASAVALGDREHVLAFEGVGHDHHHAGDELIRITAPAREDRLHVESQIRCEQPDCPLGAAIAAPLLVAGELVGIVRRALHAWAPRDPERHAYGRRGRQPRQRPARAEGDG